MANFDLYFQTLMLHEGGYVFNPKDPGGETKYGITDSLDGKTDRLVDTDEDGKGDVSVKNLTQEQAKKIYKRRFWDKIKADDINSQSVAEILFDWGVNSGAGLASRKIQSIVGVEVDGVVGKDTIKAINSKDAKTLFEQIKELRKSFYRNLIISNPKLKTFEKGWNNRIESFKFKN